MINYHCQQIEAQTKMFASIATTLTQDAEHFETSQRVFHHMLA